jgi:hypothetical protein
MADAQRGELIQIHKIVLKPEDRAPGLPESTRSVPYECWIKGFLVEESANMGDEVAIETFTGRTITGRLYAVRPTYDHNFGEPQQELLSIGKEAVAQLGKDKSKQ